MIKFKNINGDVFLAVGSVKRKSALNGEKSLSATITQGDDVLNKIDKGWSLEFDNEPYVVTYFERNDNDNTVEIDAIHKFFWDMTKSVLYNSYSNSHVARFYLDEIFKDTGYTYALNFDPKAFEKENWGMKNKLSLFNDVISSMGAEFEINGTLISIFKNVGSDLSTIVRHGFNLSDMTLENDNTNFATYAEGFGAYEDQENQKGPRLHVTYTSSLAKTFGKLHAEPIDDQRYTVKDNLLQAVKDKVDSSFAISIKLSLYDLTAAGYPYKMANVGDWLLAVDENLDFNQKIRIISVDDEFAEDGTRISYTVTCGDVGVTKKYQDANASLSQKVQSAYDNAQSAKESAIQAVISSTGKNTVYDNIDGEENLPEKANEGDLAFVQTGDGKAMYIYEKQPDGSFKWVKRLDPDTGEQIAAGVEEAIATANKHTDELNEKQAADVAKFKSETDTALNSAAADRQRISKQATDMTNSAMARANEVANKADEIDGKVVAVGKSIDGLTGVVDDKNKGLSAVFDLASNGQTLAVQAQKDATTAITTAQGVQTSVKQSQDDIKKLQDRLNSQGQANLIMNSEFNPDLEGWELTSDGGNTKLPYRSYTSRDINATTVGFDTTKGATNSWANLSQTVQLSSTPLANTSISLSWSSWAREVANYNGFHVLFYDKSNKQVGDEYREWTARGGGGDANSYTVRKKWENITVPDTATYLVLKFQAREGTGAYLAQPMLVMGPTIGDYVPGNYNNNNLVESVRTQLAGQITDEVNDRKSGDNTTRTQLTNLIDQRVTSVEKGYQSYFDQKADGILLGVGTPNLLLNTNFTPDLENWNINQQGGTTNDTFYRSILDDQGHTGVGVNIPDSAGSDSNKHYAHLEQDIQMPGWKNNVKLSLSWRIQVRHMLNYAWLWVQFLDGNKAHMKKPDGSQNNIGYNYGATGNNADGKWHDGKFENIAVPDGCVYIRISFQAREGTNLYLTSPMATFTSKAQEYMPGSYSGMNSSTVLQLFKDNWAIGLADNVGKITSGIIGDKNSLNLINNNITLQGNTTVTADFYAKGGNFNNLNASNITTGTINAAKINVINLDVSSLTGNITNFIKSYWNNAYQNLTIDANAINFSTGNSRTMIGNNRITMWNDSKGYYRVGGLLTLQYNTGTEQDHTTGIYLNLDEWHTTNKGDSNWDYGGTDFFGGSEIGISHTTGRSGNNIRYGVLMKWSNGLAASRDSGTYQGFNFYDQTTFWRPIYSSNGKKFSLGDINGVPAIFAGSAFAGIAGNDSDLYFFNKKGYISLTDIARKVGVAPMSFTSHLAW